MILGTCVSGSSSDPHPGTARKFGTIWTSQSCGGGTQFSRHFAFVVRCSQEDRDRHPAVNVVVIPNELSFHRWLVGCPSGITLCRGTWARSQLPRDRVVSRSCLAIDSTVCSGRGARHCRKNPPPVIQQAHGKLGVVVHGFVKDLASFYQTASLSIVPLHAGGGTS
jgi:hypothetical protein